MTLWASQVLVIVLAVCAVLLTALPRLGPSEKPPLDTTHDWRDLPEWLPFSEADRPGPRRGPEKSSP
ncbi:MAG TPA: hypothetical protein ENJ62_07250 [Bryobacterales bacterium]|nr:hypothetical protein [Bryobacterales bacterium]